MEKITYLVCEILYEYDRDCKKKTFAMSARQNERTQKLGGVYDENGTEQLPN